MNTHTADWRPLENDFAPSADVLAELLDGGQAFRWCQQPDGSWIGQWARNAVGLRQGPDTRLEWYNLASRDTNRAQEELVHYLGLGNRTFEQAREALPWRSDTHLEKTMTTFPGLRILRQPFGETLLAFLCSATKQIIQIKQMLALLAERHGSPVCHVLSDKPAFRALPTWTELAAIPETELRTCQLGFRARYIAQTAAYLKQQPGWLEKTAAVPYPEARRRLMTLPGVGEKIADCVALFGLGHLEAFPVDTWMIKAMTRHYQLTNWTPSQVAHFGRIHFGAAAGLAQQFLFAWERRHGGR